MVIKRVFTIKDENYNTEFEMSGKSGALISDDENFMILDMCQMAQYVIENVNGDGDWRGDITTASKEWLKIIFGIVLDSVVLNALSDIEDDDEIELIDKGD